MTGRVEPRGRVDLCSRDWDEVAPGFREKRLRAGERELRLVEISPRFVEAEWCRQPHLGYLLEGDLRLETPEGSETLVAGDGLTIAADQPHKASVASGRALLLLVETP